VFDKAQTQPVRTCSSNASYFPGMDSGVQTLRTSSKSLVIALSKFLSRFPFVMAHSVCSANAH